MDTTVPEPSEASKNELPERSLLKPPPSNGQNKGGRPKGRTRVFKIEAYATRQDAIDALRTMRYHVKRKDRNAAQYMLDRLFGPASAVKPEKVDDGSAKISVVIVLPPKYSELGKKVEISPEKPAKLSRFIGETHLAVSKPTRNDEIGGEKRGKGGRRSK